MFGTTMIDVVIGLTVVYVLLCIIASAVTEGLEGWMKVRSKVLEHGIAEMLDDPRLLKAVYEHPQVSCLYRGSYDDAHARTDLPSYIPSRSFALAILDMAARGRSVDAYGASGVSAPPLSVGSIQASVAGLENPKVQRVVRIALDTCGGEFAKVQSSIEQWFDSSMDRATGWYKRHTMAWMAGIGMTLAVAGNVDSTRIVRALYANPALREVAVAQATAIANDPLLAQRARGQNSGGAPPDSGRRAVDSTLQSATAKLGSLDLPIGWPSAEAAQLKAHPVDYILPHFLGWLVTAFAVSLGAPFWFDLLNKLVSLRGTIKPTATQDSGAAAASPAPAAAPPSVAAGGALVQPTAAPQPTVSPGPGTAYAPHEWAAGHPDGGII